MDFRTIVNPKTGRKVLTTSKLGKQIINKYLVQLGGHKGPCAINPSSGKCKKSKKADGNCKVSKKGRCIMKKNKKKIEKKVDFYNESWATIDNYCIECTKITPKILKKRREMIDEIYSVYEQYKLLDNTILHPNEWRYPPQWCYKQQLINNLNGYREDLNSAMEYDFNKIILINDQEYQNYRKKLKKEGVAKDQIQTKEEWEKWTQWKNEKIRKGEWKKEGNYNLIRGNIDKYGQSEGWEDAEKEFRRQELIDIYGSIEAAEEAMQTAYENKIDAQNYPYETPDIPLETQSKKEKKKIPDIKLDDDELIEIIKNYIPEEYSHSKYMDSALVELKKIKYDPDYTSIFGLGEPINIQSEAKRISKYTDESEAELLNHPYVHSQALIGQIVDQMGEEGFWSDLIGPYEGDSRF